jgi:uncharacterized protein YegL
MKHFVTLLFALNTSIAYSQSITLFDIEEKSFPLRKANIVAFDDQGKQQRPSLSDLMLTEDGVDRSIVTITCPPIVSPLTLSSVLVIDVSGSMEGSLEGSNKMDMAKSAARHWINALPLNLSECAIVSFDHQSYLNQDFTQNRTKLLDAVNSLTAQGGTDYNAALIDPPAGGLLLTKERSNKRIVVFLTDGSPNTPVNIEAIVEEAQEQNCAIYCVTLGMNAHDKTRELARRTGGMSFDNINSEKEAQAVYQRILTMAQGMKPCEIVWRSDYVCLTHPLSVVASWKNTSSSPITYTPSEKSSGKPTLTPTSLTFGGIVPPATKDTTIQCTAHNTDITITAIDLLYGSSDFSIVSPSLPIVVSKNTSQDITVRYTPRDSSLQYATFQIITDVCNTTFGVFGGFPGQSLNPQTLQLTSPNGGEFFVIGSNTLITWKGVAETDTCTLEYSFDNGVTWNLITDKATGLQYQWNNIPRPTSTQCLMRISHGSGRITNKQAPEIDWARTYGSDGTDVIRSFQPTSDNGFIFAAEVQKGSFDVREHRGLSDMWIVKLNAQGDIMWQKTLGGQLFDYASDIQETPDGGFIVVGSSTSTNGDFISQSTVSDSWVIKLDNQGNVEWKKRFGGTEADEATGVHTTQDGGYIVTNFSSSSDGNICNAKGGGDYWIFKLDATGTMLWEKTFGGSSSETPLSLHQEPQGSYIISGYTTSTDGNVTTQKGKSNAWLMQISPQGVLEWQRVFGGNDSEFFNAALTTPDRHSVAIGITYSMDGDLEYISNDGNLWVVKVDEQQDILWQRLYGGTSLEIGRDIITTHDNNYVAIGSTQSRDGDVTSSKSNGEDKDIWLLKIQEGGTILWDKSFGGTGEDIGSQIYELDDGSIVFSGSTSSSDGDVSTTKGDMDVWIVKLHSGVTGSPAQADTSDGVFAIVQPLVAGIDIDMQQCLMGTAKDSTVSGAISNVGTFPFTVIDISFQGIDRNAFSIASGTPPFIMAQNQLRNIEFRFTPSHIGVHKAEMLIITQADTLRRSIIGEGVLPSLEIVSGLIDFGQVRIDNQKDTLQAVTITNTQQTPLTITNTYHGGPNSIYFSTLAGGGNFTLAPGDTAKLDLRFSPNIPGRTSGQLFFDYNGIGSPATVQLFGEGIDTTSITLQVGNAQAHANEIVEIPVLLTHTSQALLATALQARVDILFNPSLLFSLDLPAHYLSPTSAFISLDSIHLQNHQSDTLILLRFKVGTGNTEQCDIQLINAAFTSENHTSIHTIDGTFKLLGICKEGGTRLIHPHAYPGSITVSPNPTNGRITISFEVVEKGPMEIALFNTLGEKVRTLFANIITGNFGKRTVEANITSLGAGNYILKLTTPTYSETENVIIIN